MPKYDVTIIGAGIAGLTAAVQLQNEGLSVKLLEATDRPGGRIKTDKVDGFLLDRGFQVLLTAYPEAQRLLDYEALKLKHFFPGSLVQYNDKTYRVADPFRKPLKALSGLMMPFAKWGDQMKILALRNRYKRLTVEQIFNEPETSTLDFLKSWHFSDQFIQSFFKPFMGGVFLENELQTSSRMFQFVFKMFTLGTAAIPQGGMEAIPQQLTGLLKPGTLETGVKVVKVQKNKVLTAQGNKIESKIVLIATEPPVAHKLLGNKNPYSINTKMHAVKCLYFTADKAPFNEPILMLNGNTHGLVNNLCVPSIVNGRCAPPGRHLVSVTVLKQLSISDEELLISVKSELRRWFKKEIRYWDHLKTYAIDWALPQKNTIRIPDKNSIKPAQPGIYVCGDYTYNGSINGAMESAKHTAHAISWDLALAANR